MTSRRTSSLEVRRSAAETAAWRPHPEHHSNSDEQRLRGENGEPSYIGNFTKCLPHDEAGFVEDPRDYEEWACAIDSGDPRDFRFLRLGPGPFQPHGDFEYKPDGKPQLEWKPSYQGLPDGPEVRAWESQGAGLTYELEGPDAQAVTMPPCPSLNSQELIAEMGKVYWQALCRDVPFANREADSTIAAASNSLKRLWWFRRDRTSEALDGATDALPESLARRRILSDSGFQCS